MTVREAIAAGAARLRAVAELHDGAARDAELLLLRQLGITKAALFAAPDRVLSADEEAAYTRSLARRAACEPVQYIVGEQEFYGRPFRVSPAVLIPRPETEHLVEAVLERVSRTAPLRLVDVGTGSGILAVTLAAHLPQAQVTALDLSPEALAVARDNAERLDVAGRIRFLESDLLDALAGEQFDVVVSNPPYIPLAERGTLHAQVREFEPGLALFAGDDGLGIYRRLVPQAHRALTPGGLLALEIGQGQHTALAELLRGWQGVEFVHDLQKIERIAVARRGPSE